MKLSDFDYDLPKELIATYPLLKREDARLMVIDRSTGSIEHHSFKDIAAYFSSGDLLVLNDTKVLPCRLKGKRISGGKVEVLLLNNKQGLVFDALLKPGRLKIGEEIQFPESEVSCRITGKKEVCFNAPGVDSVYRLGVMPLPPYIKREPEEIDKEYYQTVFASQNGSVASPTAGLHFSKTLLEDLRRKQVGISFVTLHIGYATFKPVNAEDIREHKMGREAFFIPDEAIEAIGAAQKGKKRICAVGTTSCRTLESYAQSKSLKAETDLFIYPGFKFKISNCLLTNFHLPKTTLLMLVAAFGGLPLIKEAYEQAVRNRYRFYSYGDAMLIL